MLTVIPCSLVSAILFSFSLLLTFKFDVLAVYNVVISSHCPFCHFMVDWLMAHFFHQPLFLSFLHCLLLSLYHPSWLTDLMPNFLIAWPAGLLVIIIVEFYKLFNLEVCNYIEFPFKEMINIFSLNQMMQWHSALKGSKHQSSDYAITLVSFKPIMSNDGEDRRQIAHLKVHEMFKDCFHDGSMNKIDVCMKTFPMMAIFFSKKMKVIHNKRKLSASKQNTGSCKDKSSIFDSSPQQVHCLSAVNYFQHEQNTAMLWLAAMRAKPFKESINCV